MKNFIIALCFLITVTVAVLYNCIFAERLYSDINENLSRLPQISYSGSNDSEIQRTTELLEQNKKYFYLTTPHGMVNDFFCDYREMVAYFYAGDTSSYLAGIEKVKLRLQFLKKAETLPFHCNETSGKK